ncbi:hypothetical protein DXG01_010778 [Tephrocybe rancida]|nr:hypothetical protein DXG01_010778 [Tephrocybe rancida]
MTSSHSPDVTHDSAILTQGEILWRDHYNFLKEHGYTLRKRYEPGWVPSWLNTSQKPRSCEDGLRAPNYQILDVTCVDGSLAAVKRVDVKKHPEELALTKHMSSGAFVSHPRNHCVPILDIIDPPEGSHTAFIVMPFLFELDFPSFETIGEVVECCRQIFEGLLYMHENNVVHGDCKRDNIMADTLHLFNAPPHPVRSYMKRDFSGIISKPVPRTLRPVKYFLIDFDLSKVYRPEDAPFLRDPPWGGDSTVPEHQIPGGPPCDPFAVDVYCLGNVVKHYFFDGVDSRRPALQGLEFLRELANDMVNSEPTKRPSMAEVVSRFDVIIAGLGNWTLRSPLVPVGTQRPFSKSIVHWSKQLTRMARRIPAIPKA